MGDLGWFQNLAGHQMWRLKPIQSSTFPTTHISHLNLLEPLQHPEWAIEWWTGVGVGADLGRKGNRKVKGGRGLCQKTVPEHEGLPENQPCRSFQVLARG